MNTADKKPLFDVTISETLENSAQYEWVSQKQEVVLFKEEGKVRAFSSICPHMGARLCYRSADKQLVCPWHGWSFHTQTRESNHPRYKSLKEYEVKEGPDDAVPAVKLLGS